MSYEPKAKNNCPTGQKPAAEQKKAPEQQNKKYAPAQNKGGPTQSR